jgi:hypothetical protein
MENSDVDFNTLVTDTRKVRTHRFILRGCLFSVAARTEDDWVEELTSPNDGLPLVVGSLKSMRPIYDPEGRFERLRNRAEELPTDCWKNAVRVGLEEMVEDLGRVRNAHLSRDSAVFRLYSPRVAIEAALVYSSLRREAVLSENDLLNEAQRYAPTILESLLVGAGVKSSGMKLVLNSLETLFDTLWSEARGQGATPVSYAVASSYTPRQTQPFRKKAR